MAFETVSGQETISLNKMEDGKSFVGFLKSIVVEKDNYGNDKANMLMLSEDKSKEYKILTGGAAKYVAMNIAMATGLVKANDKYKKDQAEKDATMLGCLVKITKTGSYKNKQGKEVTTFEFQVDREQKI